MLTGSDSFLPTSKLSSSSAIIVTGGGGGGFGLGFDFDFVPEPDFPETAPTMEEEAGVVAVKDDENPWFKEQREGLAILKRCRFGVITRKGY